MLIPNTIMWLAATIAAVWKTSQLVRMPRDRGLQIVTSCTILVFIALTAQLIVTIPGLAGQFPSQTPKLIQNTLLTVFFALLIVLLQSTLVPARLGARGWNEIALALTASAGLTIAFFATDPAVRGAGYGDTTGQPGVVVFYLIGNLYLLYATARGAVLAWSSAAHVQTRLRRSLRVAAGGLAICCLGAHLPRVLSTAGRLAWDVDPIPATATWTPIALAIGIAIFFLGIGYPGVRTGIIKVRLWRQARRAYRQLRPLWVALHHRFPTIALFTAPGPVHETVQIRHMRLRMYRRVMECRDGLVSLSPYTTTPVDASHSPARQAELVHDALTRSTREHEPAETSVIAAPGAADMDADTNELLALSRAFAKLDPVSADHATA